MRCCAWTRPDCAAWLWKMVWKNLVHWMGWTSWLVWSQRTGKRNLEKSGSPHTSKQENGMSESILRENSFACFLHLHCHFHYHCFRCHSSLRDPRALLEARAGWRRKRKKREKEENGLCGKCLDTGGSTERLSDQRTNLSSSSSRVAFPRASLRSQSRRKSRGRQPTNSTKRFPLFFFFFSFFLVAFCPCPLVLCARASVERSRMCGFTVRKRDC